MEKTYQIRYNTKSENDSTNWRLICGSEEILVSDIHITSKTKTTKNYIEELSEYKYHITCTGFLTIKDNIAYITTNEEKKSLKRHLAKTISYRIMATCVTISTALFLGVNLEFSVLLGVGEIFVKPVFYFIHERLWFKLRFNKK